MSPTDPHTLVGPYVLDALAPEERQLFEEHLERCGDCRADVEELRATAARLARSSAVTPPPELRDRVLAEVARTRQAPPGQPGERPRSSPRWAVALGAAAVVVVIALLGTMVIRADRRADDAEQIAAVTAAPDARTIEVTGESTSMRVVVSDERGASVVIAEDLDAVPAGKAYALWFREDGKMVLQDLFEPGADGAVEELVESTPTDLVGVTVEDDSGATEPTPPILATGTL